MDGNTNNYCPNLESTSLSRAYFSSKNIDYLQNELRSRILEQSAGQFNICRQSDRELLIIMRSYYLTYARHVVGHEEEEIDSLNERVLNYAVPNVLGGIHEAKRNLVDMYGPGLNTFDRQGVVTRDYKSLELNHFF